MDVNSCVNGRRDLGVEYLTILVHHFLGHAHFEGLQVDIVAVDATDAGISNGLLVEVESQLSTVDISTAVA